MQRSSLNLDNARATSDACLLFPRLSRPAIPGLEVTELPPGEGWLQFRLARALFARNPARDFQNTQPLWGAQ